MCVSHERSGLSYRVTETAKTAHDQCGVFYANAIGQFSTFHALWVKRHDSPG